MKLIPSLVVLATCLVGFSQQIDLSKQQFFSNPIFDGNSADPSVMKLGDYYYLTLSENKETELTIFKSRTLTNFRNAEKVVAYTTKPGQFDLWATEMHMVNGELYIYFTFQVEGDSLFHRMYAIRADDPTNPMGNWSEPITLLPDYPYWAIDGTVMKHGNGKMYFVWSSTLDNQGNCIFIAEMYDGVTISPDWILLRKPSSDWEGGVNEGPYFIYRNNVSFLVFSAASTFNTEYCLGVMSIDGDKDPMVKENWWFGEDYPVFWKDPTESVYTTGHASFTVSNDETETWMVYHAAPNETHVLGYRVARIEKIVWDEYGRPIFPRPHGFNHPQPVPSGHPVNSTLLH